LLWYDNAVNLVAILEVTVLIGVGGVLARAAATGGMKNTQIAFLCYIMEHNTAGGIDHPSAARDVEKGDRVCFTNARVAGTQTTTLALTLFGVSAAARGVKSGDQLIRHSSFLFQPHSTLLQAGVAGRAPSEQ